MRNPGTSELPGCEIPAPQNYRAQPGISARHPGPHLGLGYEHHLGHGGTYLSAEYRHVFVDHHEGNAVTIGFGTFF